MIAVMQIVNIVPYWLVLGPGHRLLNLPSIYLHVGPDQPEPRTSPHPSPEHKPEPFGGFEVGRGRGSHAVEPRILVAFSQQQQKTCGRRTSLDQSGPQPAQSFVPIAAAHPFPNGVDCNLLFTFRCRGRFSCTRYSTLRIPQQQQQQ